MLASGSILGSQGEDNGYILQLYTPTSIETAPFNPLPPHEDEKSFVFPPPPPPPPIAPLTNNAEGKKRRKSSHDRVMTPRTVMSASPTNLPNVPASVARKPEFHVPLFYSI